MGEGLRVGVTAVGLEPTANRLKADCSTTELHGRTFCHREVGLFNQPDYISTTLVYHGLSRLFGAFGGLDSSEFTKILYPLSQHLT